MRPDRPSVVALALLVAGCSLLPAPRAGRDRFFTLTPVGAGQPDGSAGGPVYGVGPIQLPAYLDRNEVVVRLSPTEIRYADGDRWAEPLRTNVALVLQQNLAAMLDNPRVLVFPWPREAPVAHAVEIGFTRFEADAAGHAGLSARWSIRDARTGRYLTLRETTLTRPAPPGDMPAAVAALSALLADLALEIAGDLRRVAAPAAAEAADAAASGTPARSSAPRAPGARAAGRPAPAPPR